LKIYNRSTAQEICNAVDSISISLNMPDAESYTEVVRPAYGEKDFGAMLRFTQDCKTYLNDVRFLFLVSERNEREIEFALHMVEQLLKGFGAGRLSDFLHTAFVCHRTI